MAKRPTLGDVFEIPLSVGFGYGQYILKHIDPPCYGEFVRIFCGIRTERPTEWHALSSENEQFLAFYALGTAVRYQAVKLVGHADIPERLKMFPAFKTYGRFEQKPSGRILSWILGSGANAKSVEDSQLTAEQRQLPLRQIINHDTLVRRIETGWTHSSSHIDL